MAVALDKPAAYTLQGLATLPGAPAPPAAPAPVPMALPPARHVPGSPANYWPLNEQIIANMQWTVIPLDHSVPVFKEPHACLEGTVGKLIAETDGDTHMWLILDNTSKAQIACEFIPQATRGTPAATPPNEGDHVRVYGIFRYDLQHAWSELHPVDYWEKI